MSWISNDFSSLICRDCTLKDHPRETHDFNFINDVVDEEREKIKQVNDSSYMHEGTIFV